MLWTIAVILLVLWGLGLVTSYTLGGFIHILLILAVVTVADPPDPGPPRAAMKRLAMAALLAAFACAPSVAWAETTGARSTARRRRDRPAARRARAGRFLSRRGG